MSYQGHHFSGHNFGNLAFRPAARPQSFGPLPQPVSRGQYDIATGLSFALPAAPAQSPYGTAAPLPAPTSHPAHTPSPATPVNISISTGATNAVATQYNSTYNVATPAQQLPVVPVQSLQTPSAQLPSATLETPNVPSQTSKIPRVKERFNALQSATAFLIQLTNGNLHQAGEAMRLMTELKGAQNLVHESSEALSESLSNTDEAAWRFTLQQAFFVSASAERRLYEIAGEAIDAFNRLGSDSATMFQKDIKNTTMAFARARIADVISFSRPDRANDESQVETTFGSPLEAVPVGSASAFGLAGTFPYPIPALYSARLAQQEMNRNRLVLNKTLGLGRELDHSPYTLTRWKNGDPAQGDEDLTRAPKLDEAEPAEQINVRKPQRLRLTLKKRIGVDGKELTSVPQRNIAASNRMAAMLKKSRTYESEKAAGSMKRRRNENDMDLDDDYSAKRQKLEQTKRELETVFLLRRCPFGCCDTRECHRND